MVTNTATTITQSNLQGTAHIIKQKEALSEGRTRKSENITKARKPNHVFRSRVCLSAHINTFHKKSPWYFPGKQLIETLKFFAKEAHNAGSKKYESQYPRWQLMLFWCGKSGDWKKKVENPLAQLGWFLSYPRFRASGHKVFACF